MASLSQPNHILKPLIALSVGQEMTPHTYSVGYCGPQKVAATFFLLVRFTIALVLNETRAGGTSCASHTLQTVVNQLGGLAVRIRRSLPLFIQIEKDLRV